MMKTINANDLIDHMGAAYAKNYIELLGTIGPSAVCTKKQAW